jgi:hypothetical protein
LLKENNTGVIDDDVEVSFRFCHEEKRHIKGEVNAIYNDEFTG